MNKKVILLSFILCLAASLMIPSFTFADDLVLITETPVQVDLTENSSESISDSGSTALPEPTIDPNVPTVVLTQLLNDEAGLLSAEQQVKLQKHLEELSDKYDLAVVIHTTQSLNGKTVENYADDYFDYNGFAGSRVNGGILFLLAMDSRDWYVSTFGRAIDIFTDYGINNIGNQVVSSLSSGNYYDAFCKFGDLVGEYIDQANSGPAFDTNNQYKEPYKVLSIKRIIGDLLAGFGIAFAPVSAMKSKMKTVSQNNSARNYVKKNSLKLYRSTDRIINRNVSRVPIQQRSSDSGGSGMGGGSSIHISSSGHTHGGGGGKF